MALSVTATEPFAGNPVRKPEDGLDQDPCSRVVPFPLVHVGHGDQQVTISRDRPFLQTFPLPASRSRPDNHPNPDIHKSHRMRKISGPIGAEQAQRVRFTRNRHGVIY